MSHPRSLIEKICGLLEQDYPRTHYQYVLEKALPGVRVTEDNSRAMPDIAVYQGDKPICLVEIGYTRPEKLTFYREGLGVHDVRWYSKSGQLHTPLEHKSIKVDVSIEPVGAFHVYRTTHEIGCDGCWNEWHDDENDVDYDMDDDMDESTAYVTSALVTDGKTVAWILNFCDKCGGWWWSSPSHLGEEIFLLQEFVDTPEKSFLSRDGRMYVGTTTWKNIARTLQKTFDPAWPSRALNRQFGVLVETPALSTLNPRYLEDALFFEEVLYFGKAENNLVQTHVRRIKHEILDLERLAA